MSIKLAFLAIAFVFSVNGVFAAEVSCTTKYDETMAVAKAVAQKCQADVKAAHPEADSPAKAAAWAVCKSAWDVQNVPALAAKTACIAEIQKAEEAKRAEEESALIQKKAAAAEKRKAAEAKRAIADEEKRKAAVALQQEAEANILRAKCVQTKKNEIENAQFEWGKCHKDPRFCTEKKDRKIAAAKKTARDCAKLTAVEIIAKAKEEAAEAARKEAEEEAREAAREAAAATKTRIEKSCKDSEERTMNTLWNDRRQCITVCEARRKGNSCSTGCQNTYDSAYNEAEKRINACISRSTPSVAIK
jgi:hypothetical protein